MPNSPETMTPEFLQYNRWANLQLIDACLELSPEQLASSAPGGYGGIYDTLLHLVSAEASYYRRLSGGVRLEPPTPWENSPSMGELRAFSDRVSRALVEVAGQLGFGDSFERTWNDEEWQDAPSRLRSVGLLIQVVDHGIEHRTNITTILAAQGLPSPDLSGWEYMRTHPDRMGA